MKEYHIDDLKSATTVRLSIFQEKVDGTFEYDKLVIDEGYRGTVYHDKPKFGFVFERVDKIATKDNSWTMTQFKKYITYMDFMTDCYRKLKNEDCTIDIPEDKQVYIRAQTGSDIYDSQFDGAHCSLVLKLVSFRCVKRESNYF